MPKAKPQQAWQNRIIKSGEMPAHQFLAHPLNARRHPGNQRDALRGSLDAVGWVAPVIVSSRSGKMLDGHARIEEALTRNDEQLIPFVEVDVSEDEERLILATFDPITALATYDKDALEALLADLDVSDGLQAMLDELAASKGLHLPNAGAGGDEFDTTPDDGPTRTQSGDLWIIGGRHRLICGDATDAATVTRLMAGQKAQMVFTDPPYGVNYTGGQKRRDELQNDEIGTSIYEQSLRHLRQAADDECALYLWYADGHAAAAAAAAAAAGYCITAQIIWAKNHAQFVTSAHYKGKHEPCYYAHRSGKTARWFGPNNEVTLWEYDRSPSNDFHPTQKPVAIAERAIRNSSDRGQLVLDMFLGSGTTLIAAHREGRTCYGLEIEPRYCDVILKRAEAEGLECEKAQDGKTAAQD